MYSPRSPFLWLMASTTIHLQFLDFVFVLASASTKIHVQFSLLIMQQLWTDIQLTSSKAHYLFICNLLFSLQEKLYKFDFLLHFFKCISIYAYINRVASNYTVILKLVLDLAYVFFKDCIIELLYKKYVFSEWHVSLNLNVQILTIGRLSLLYMQISAWEQLRLCTCLPET